MKIGILILLLLLFAADWILKKKFPRFYKRLGLPCNILFSGAVASHCFILIYSEYTVLTSEVSLSDKVFFVLFVGCVIAVYAILVAYVWKNWLKERKEKD